MKKLGILRLLIAAFTIAGAAQDSKLVVRLDPALDAIVPPNAKLEKLAGNLLHLESPVWVRKSGFLLFSDVEAFVMYKWDPTTDKVSIYPDDTAKPNSNGITVDPEGRVVYCAICDRQVVRIEKDGKHTVLAGEYDGKPLNKPNDLVYKSDGALYFTDPTDISPKEGPDFEKEMAMNHVFLLRNGKLQVLNTKEIQHPNGLALTPDEKSLYLIDSRTQKMLFRYDVLSDDTIANGKVYVDMKLEKGPGGPDGMKVDEKGNVYAPGPNGLWIISPEGKHLGTVTIPEIFANLAFGDADGKSLYLAGHTSLYRIRLNIQGIHP